MICFKCGDEGHIASECTFDDTGSPYCGICDQRTRLATMADGRPGRCPECHPLRHQHLRQFRRCPGCRMLVHEWDTAPCGHHSSPVAKDRKPPIEHIREIVSDNS